ncbi:MULTISPECIES: diguanylate cyclase [Pseudomonas]|uniref:diguanylate cyclase n=1 Tax=Pseudomonas quercus TaxID=2722792 RepID=A0ABX0YHX3_9PSED|nr:MULTISPECIES: diguanylate cyclase [Pseudomonas]MBF7143042.1 GGDEF domain-containing protein [Pseudomonas sp. LY10J]NJP01929.1 GGDEF domain-containing protein [Pseudomonas quercus]
MAYRKTNLLLAAMAAMLVMSITAAISPVTLFWTNQTRMERNLVEQQLDSLRVLQSLLVDAETGQRGYVLTGKEPFLQPYFVASAQLPGAIRHLTEIYEDSLPDDIGRVNSLIARAHLKMDHLDKVVKLRSEVGYNAAEAEIAGGHGKQLMDDVREATQELTADETAKIARLDDQLQANLRLAVVVSVATFLLTLALGRFIYVSMRRAVQQQTLSAQQQAESAATAQVASARLSQSLERLEHRNLEVSLLAEMARLLQTELSQEETLQLANSYCQRLLEGSAGTFFLYRNSADALLPAASWGAVALPPDTLLSPKDCWAIRRARVHLVEQGHDLCCAHYPHHTDTVTYTHWCIPLLAYGETLGLLHIYRDARQPTEEASLKCAEAIAEQTALALANGRMRQVLQTQSIRDPLTGLYNRRFMEETLERELARARRTHACLSVIMLDLDHFKRLNDNYGHPAGDSVLRAVSALLLGALRASDIACRFGGEELIVILPDCALEGAVARAEAIRAEFAAMTLHELGQPLTVTASFGVCSTAVCGADQSLLLKAADTALYKAKQSGRNRVQSCLDA